MADKKISALTGASTPLAGTEVLPIVQSGATVKVSAANITAGRAVSMASLNAVGNGAGGTQTLATFNAAADAFSNSVELALEPLISGQSRTGIGAQREGVGTGAAVYLKAGGNEVLRGTVAGDISVATGNVVMATAGKGIDFSANSNAPGMTSELLNWYEEGVWTPTVTSQTGAITSYVSGGTYTRVGRQVTVTAYVDLTNVGTAGGFLQISNFPYKNGGASGAGYLQQMGVVRETGVTGVIYAALLNGNSTNASISSLAGGAVVWSNSYQYAISMTYYTA